MASLISQVESILFVASKPLGIKKIAKVLNVSEGEIENCLNTLREKYNNADSGVSLLTTASEFQLVSNPENKAAAEHFMKAELSGELTRPQLETLTVISYCGPITKPEIEQIRGVNCSLILRNLLMRGLVKESEKETNLLPLYEVTMEYLQHLGISSLSELPDYNELHNHEYVMNALNAPVSGTAQ